MTTNKKPLDKNGIKPHIIKVATTLATSFDRLKKRRASRQFLTVFLCPKSAYRTCFMVGWRGKPTGLLVSLTSLSTPVTTPPNGLTAIARLKP